MCIREAEDHTALLNFATRYFKLFRQSQYEKSQNQVFQMKPKRILIISAYFPPYPSVASLRPYSYAKYWAKMGHEVTVLTTKKYDSDSADLVLPIDKFDVVEVSYCDIKYKVAKALGMFRPERKSHSCDVGSKPIDEQNGQSLNRSFRGGKFLKKLRNISGRLLTDRIPDYRDPWIIPAIRRAKALIRSRDIQWIFSSYAPPSSHIIAGMLRKEYACRWIADYRDLWLENVVWVGKWPFTILEKWLENKYVGGCADIITTVSQPLAEILRNKFKTPVYVIENGYDEEDYDKHFPPYFAERKKRIIYTGTLWPGRRDPSPLFAAISSLANESMKIRAMMDHGIEVLFFGAESEWLNKLIGNHGVQRWVKYKGIVGGKDIRRIQSQADVLLFLENGEADGILTGKLFEYLAAQRPILGVGVSSKTTAGSLMENAGVGLAVDSDVAKIRHVVMNLLEGHDPFPISPNEGVIGQYTRKKQAARILEIMDQI